MEGGGGAGSPVFGSWVFCVTALPKHPGDGARGEQHCYYCVPPLVDTTACGVQVGNCLLAQWPHLGPQC